MHEPEGTVPVLLNASAGTRSTDVQQLQQQLGGTRVTIRAIPPQALSEHVRAEVDAGTPVVGVAGGDGTMNTAAAVLAGTDTVLLCVPTGTLNTFARRVGIETVADAGAALARGDIRTAAIGAVNHGVFLNTVTFGEYTRVVRMRERYRRYVGKWPAAFVAFTVALLNVHRITIRLRAGDVDLTRRTPFVWVGIGRDSFPRVREAAERHDGPELEVAVLRSERAVHDAAFLVRLAVHVLRGTHAGSDRMLETLHSRSVTLEARHRIDATADGEPCRLRPPIRIALHADGLRVLTGSRTEDES